MYNISWEVSKSSFECRIRSRDPGHAHFGVVLWSGRSRGPSSICLSQIWSGYLYIRSKVIRGSQNFEIWSRDPGHAHLGVFLYVVRMQWGPSSIAVPNLKHLHSFKSYKGGPKFSKIGHVTQATPTLGSFYGPHVGWVRPLCLHQIWSG